MESDDDISEEIEEEEINEDDGTSEEIEEEVIENDGNADISVDGIPSDESIDPNHLIQWDYEDLDSDDDYEGLHGGQNSPGEINRNEESPSLQDVNPAIGAFAPPRRRAQSAPPSDSSSEETSGTNREEERKTRRNKKVLKKPKLEVQEEEPVEASEAVPSNEIVLPTRRRSARLAQKTAAPNKLKQEIKEEDEEPVEASEAAPSNEIVLPTRRRSARLAQKTAAPNKLKQEIKEEDEEPEVAPEKRRGNGRMEVKLEIKEEVEEQDEALDLANRRHIQMFESGLYERAKPLFDRGLVILNKYKAAQAGKSDNS